MKNQIINEIQQKMSNILNNEQKEKLTEVLKYVFFNIEFRYNELLFENERERIDYITLFISAKKIEGCSERTLIYYKSTIENMITSINKRINCIETEDLRNYLVKYQSINNCSKITLDNVRRILSSFYSWLEDENYVMKSPVRRIHKVKTAQTVKETYIDEDIESMRAHVKMLEI